MSKNPGSVPLSVPLALPLVVPPCCTLCTEPADLCKGDKYQQTSYFYRSNKQS